MGITAVVVNAEQFCGTEEPISFVSIVWNLQMGEEINAMK